jgi:hypothetical protein
MGEEVSVSGPALRKHGRLIGLAALALVVHCTERSPGPPDIASPSADAPRVAAASLVCDAANGGITLPPGFCAIVADQVGLARHVAVRPSGDVYVALRKAPNGSDNGGILALRDTNGDGRADRKVRFGTLGGTGIAWYQGALYFAADDRILRYTVSGSGLVPSSAPEQQRAPVHGIRPWL